MQSSIEKVKPRIFTIVIVGILALSIIATAVAAIEQVAGEERVGPPAALAAPAELEEGQEGAFVSSFKFACPFH